MLVTASPSIEIGTESSKAPSSHTWLVFILGGLPSLFWALWGADYLTDDFVVAMWFEHMGIAEALRSIAVERPGRPLAGFYYLFIYQGIGDAPMLQALWLGLVNGAMAAAVQRTSLLFVSARTAFLGGVLIALMPDRATSRLWFVVGSYVLAIIIVCLATQVLWRKRWILPSAILFASSVLLYEGVIGLAVISGAWWTWSKRAWRGGAIVLAGPVAAALVMLALSPKAGGLRFGAVDTIAHGLFGEGLWGPGVLGLVGLIAMLGLIVWSAVSAIPKYHRPGNRFDTELRRATATALAAAAPLAYVSLIFGSGGINDRNNLVPSVGVGLIIAAAIHHLQNRNRVAGHALITATIALFVVLNVADVADYVGAVRDGATVSERVIADIEPGKGLVLVGPPLDGGRGMEQFILQEDLRASLLLREGLSWSTVWMAKDPASCRRLAERFGSDSGSVVFYDWRSRSTVEFEDRHCEL